MSHHCRNPNFCPICRQKIKREIVEFFRENPNIIVSFKILQQNFNLKYRTLQTIMHRLVSKKIIIRKYSFNKRLSIGSGVRIGFMLSPKAYRPDEVNSKSWIKIF